MAKIGAKPAAVPGAGPPAPAVKAPTLLLDSADETLVNPVIVIHGPYGAGKTTCAASASEFFPDELTTKRVGAKGKLVELEDMVWLAFDNGALDGFRERGLRVMSF